MHDVARAMAAVVRAARDLDALHARAPGVPHEGVRFRVALHAAIERLDDLANNAALAVICVPGREEDGSDSFWYVFDWKRMRCVREIGYGATAQTARPL